METIQILCHRGFWNTAEEQNTMRSFKLAFENGFGIETDIRDQGSELVISHDLPSNNKMPTLSNMLDLYCNMSNNRNHLAINIKADGIAEDVLKCLKLYEIENYFTFDMSIPETIRYKELGVKYFARLSEFEEDSSLGRFSSGVWLDAFKRNWYNDTHILKILANYKKICFVSFELHGRDFQDQWSMIKNTPFKGTHMLCTDKPIQAKEYFTSD